MIMSFAVLSRILLRHCCNNGLLTGKGVKSQPTNTLDYNFIIYIHEL